MKPSVLVVEDDADLLMLVTRMLEDEGCVCAATRNGTEALAQAERFPPDVVLLDLGLPGMDGREVFRRLRRMSAVPIIVLTAVKDEAVKVEMLDLGTADYLVKPVGRAELVARVRNVLRRAEGRTGHAPDGAGLPADLTPREEDIARLLVEGLSNEEIGKRLGISAGTVKNVLSGMYQKFYVRNRTELVGRLMGRR